MFMNLNLKLKKDNLRYVHVIKQLKTHISNVVKLRNRKKNEHVNSSQDQMKVTCKSRSIEESRGLRTDANKTTL